jgi:hypothetical protein
MKRATLIILAAVALPATVQAQAGGQDAMIARAVAPAPARLQADASVVSFANDGTITVVRQGSNGLMCWDESTSEAFSATCTSEENKARASQNWQINHSGGTDEEIQAKFDQAEANGTREQSAFGTIFYHLDGATQETARAHFTIVVPNATGESLGVPTRPRQDGIWLMDAGTSTAHLMIPGH